MGQVACMSFQPPLEDGAVDIIFKAQRGLKYDDAELSKRSGVSVETIDSFRKSSRADESILRALSETLELNATAVLAIARATYSPEPIRVIEGLRAFNTPFDDMTVNSYLLWDPETLDAAFFDTGSDGQGMLDAASERGLAVKTIFLTHTHTDHIYDLDRLIEKTGAKAWVGDREPLTGADTFAAGRKFSIGWLKVETRLTCGHSKGGITYVIKGLSQPVAIVGDAVFAGSMGGGMVSFEDALRTNRSEIMTLPNNTILCPGHGPMTTVAEQRVFNPFLAV